MYIVLNFQVSKKMVYIPDGYVGNLRELKESFLLWMEDQPECIQHDKKFGYCFDEGTVLKYINDIILSESQEQAYFVSSPTRGRKKIPTISF